ncbi:MAG: sigma-70 family RNA polymerase sigma factor [Bacilli bacterium]
MDYKDINDNEIIYYVKDNNEEASAILFKKYEPLIVMTAKRLYKYMANSGLEINDLVQEGMLALNSAIESFSENKDTSFYTYAKTCIENKIISMIVANTSNKHKILNESIPFEISDDDGERLLFGNILEDINSNPESLLISKESEKNLISKVKEKLTDFENQVFELKLNDFSYKEIAEILDRDLKSIDNALQRIKLKVKENLNIE